MDKNTAVRLAENEGFSIDSDVISGFLDWLSFVDNAICKEETSHG